MCGNSPSWGHASDGGCGGEHGCGHRGGGSRTARGPTAGSLQGGKPSVRCRHQVSLTVATVGHPCEGVVVHLCHCKRRQKQYGPGGVGGGGGVQDLRGRRRGRRNCEVPVLLLRPPRKTFRQWCSVGKQRGSKHKTHLIPAASIWDSTCPPRSQHQAVGSACPQWPEPRWVQGLLAQPAQALCPPWALGPPCSRCTTWRQWPKKNSCATRKTTT